MLTVKVGVNLTLLCTVLSLSVLSTGITHLTAFNIRYVGLDHNFRQKRSGNGTISAYFAVELQRMPVATKKPENMDFESALAELESLVNQLEEGDLSLEQSLKSFERGVQLVRAGQQRLSSAEQQVQILLQQDTEQLEPFTRLAEGQ